jgi:hypothetical protein
MGIRRTRSYYTLWSGGILLCVALILAIKTAHFVFGAAHAPGDVLSLVPGPKAGVAPHVRFTAASGSAVEFTSAVASSPPSHRVGEQVMVLYDPANPQHAEIEGFFTLWSPPVAFGAVGLVVLVLGLLGFTMRQRPQ